MKKRSDLFERGLRRGGTHESSSLASTIFLLPLVAFSLIAVGFSGWTSGLEDPSVEANIEVAIATVAASNDIFTRCENTASFSYGSEGIVVDGVAKQSSGTLSYEAEINAVLALSNGYIAANQFAFTASLSSNVNILADATYLGTTSITGDAVASSSLGTITYGTTDYSASIPITLTLSDNAVSSGENIVFSISFPFSGITSSVVTESSLIFNLSLEASKS